MPLHLYEGLSGRLLTPILQAKRCPGTQRRAVLQRRGKRLRQAGPHTLLSCRGASHCASPEVRPWSEAHPALTDGPGWTSHAIVQERARAVVEQTKRASERSGPKSTRWHSTRSPAGPWGRSRRVVSQAEGSDPGVNPRGVVTARDQARPTGLSQPIAGARGHAENASKEHQRSRQAERTAGHRCAANPWRCWWPAAASV